MSASSRGGGGGTAAAAPLPSPLAAGRSSRGRLSGIPPRRPATTGSIGSNTSGGGSGGGRGASTTNARYGARRPAAPASPAPAPAPPASALPAWAQRVIDAEEAEGDGVPVQVIPPYAPPPAGRSVADAFLDVSTVSSLPAYSGSAVLDTTGRTSGAAWGPPSPTPLPSLSDIVSPVTSPYNYMATKFGMRGSTDLLMMAASEGIVYHEAFAVMDEDHDGWLRPGDVTRFMHYHNLPYVADADALEAFVTAAAHHDYGGSLTAPVVGGGLDFNRFVRVIRADTTHTFKKLALALSEYRQAVMEQRVAVEAAAAALRRPGALVSGGGSGSGGGALLPPISPAGMPPVGSPRHSRGIAAPHFESVAAGAGSPTLARTASFGDVVGDHHGDSVASIGLSPAEMDDIAAGHHKLTTLKARALDASAPSSAEAPGEGGFGTWVAAPAPATTPRRVPTSRTAHTGADAAPPLSPLLEAPATTDAGISLVWDPPPPVFAPATPARTPATPTSAVARAAADAYVVARRDREAAVTSGSLFHGHAGAASRGSGVDERTGADEDGEEGAPPLRSPSGVPETIMAAARAALEAAPLTREVLDVPPNPAATMLEAFNQRVSKIFDGVGEHDRDIEALARDAARPLTPYFVWRQRGTSGPGSPTPLAASGGHADSGKGAAAGGIADAPPPPLRDYLVLTQKSDRRLQAGAAAAISRLHMAQDTLERVGNPAYTAFFRGVKDAQAVGSSARERAAARRAQRSGGGGGGVATAGGSSTHHDVDERDLDAEASVEITLPLPPHPPPSASASLSPAAAPAPESPPPPTAGAEAPPATTPAAGATRLTATTSFRLPTLATSDGSPGSGDSPPLALPALSMGDGGGHEGGASRPTSRGTYLGGGMRPFTPGSPVAANPHAAAAAAVDAGMVAALRMYMSRMESPAGPPHTPGAATLPALFGPSAAVGSALGEALARARTGSSLSRPQTATSQRPSRGGIGFMGSGGGGGGGGLHTESFDDFGVSLGLPPFSHTGGGGGADGDGGTAGASPASAGTAGSPGAVGGRPSTGGSLRGGGGLAIALGPIAEAAAAETLPSSALPEQHAGVDTAAAPSVPLSASDDADAPPAEPPIGNLWMQAMDASSGCMYYNNAGTGVSSWEMPTAPPAPPGTEPTLCMECEARVASRTCAGCGGDALCTPCFNAWHARGGRRLHAFSPLSQPASAPVDSVVPGAVIDDVVDATAPPPPPAVTRSVAPQAPTFALPPIGSPRPPPVDTLAGARGAAAVALPPWPPIMPTGTTRRASVGGGGGADASDNAVMMTVVPGAVRNVHGKPLNKMDVFLAAPEYLRPSSSSGGRRGTTPSRPLPRLVETDGIGADPTTVVSREAAAAASVAAMAEPWDPVRGEDDRHIWQAYYDKEREVAVYYSRALGLSTLEPPSGASIVPMTPAASAAIRAAAANAAAAQAATEATTFVSVAAKARGDGGGDDAEPARPGTSGSGRGMHLAGGGGGGGSAGSIGTGGSGPSSAQPTSSRATTPLATARPRSSSRSNNAMPSPAVMSNRRSFSGASSGRKL